MIVLFFHFGNTFFKYLSTTPQERKIAKCSTWIFLLDANVQSLSFY